MKILKVKCNSNGISTAARIIQDGGIVIFPTDTVYGIGCDPYNKKSVDRIYKIKNRKAEKPFPILGFSKEEISKIAVVDEKATKVAKKFWPGQITLILPLKDERLKKSMNLQNKVAVRVPNNQCALGLLKQCGLIVGTSANISDSKSIRDPAKCAKSLKNYDLILDGGIISSTGESTVVEIDNQVKIHREGEISKVEILKLF